MKARRCPACGTEPEVDSQRGYCTFPEGKLDTMLIVECPRCGLSTTFCRADDPNMTIEQVVGIWNTQPLVDNLAAIVKGLAYKVLKATPNDERAKRAVKFLEQHDLQGSCLRKD